MKIIRIIIIGLVLFFHNNAYSSNEPIMIIRFNTPQINISGPLKQVVAAAISRKANVFFDIVSVIPTRQNYLHEQARTNEIVENMIKSMGVSASKIRASSERSSKVNFKETHIFVR